MRVAFALLVLSVPQVIRQPLPLSAGAVPLGFQYYRSTIYIYYPIYIGTVGDEFIYKGQMVLILHYPLEQ